MIPHITLATGFLEHPDALEGLTDVVQNLAQRVKPLTLRLGRPYLDPVHRGYVLCAIGEHPDLHKLRKSVSEAVPGAFLPLRKMGSHGAHLTLAHIDAHHDRVHLYLQQVEANSGRWCVPAWRLLVPGTMGHASIDYLGAVSQVEMIAQKICAPTR